jgi:tetratricopeptide (TPR) repeat protein
MSPLSAAPPPATRRRRWAVAALLVLVAPAASTAPPPAARVPWIVVTTPAVRVYGDAGERKAREIATTLERFRAALQQIQPELAHTVPVPTRVLVFRSDAAYRPYKPGTGGRELVAHFIGSEGINYVALNGFPHRGEALPAVYHEYTHFLLQRNFRRLPLWLNEGLAEYYSSFAIEGDEVRLGRALPQHVRWLRQRSFLPLARLFAIEPTSAEYREGERLGTVYSQSWLLVHYLLTGDDERRGRAGRLFAQLEAGAAFEAALRDTFAMDLAQLESALRAYVNSPGFGFYRVPLTRLDAAAPSAASPVAAADVLYLLGDLLSHSGEERSGAAEEHLRAALAIAPGHGDALTGLAALRERLGDPAAPQLFAQAEAAQPREASSWFAIGAHLVDRARSGLGLSDELPRARAALERALALHPGYGAAALRLGLTHLIDGTDPAAGVRWLQEALDSLPPREDVPFNLAMAHLAAGDPAAARRVVDAELRPIATPATLARAEEAIRRDERVRAANAALESGRIDEGVVLYREAIAATSDPGLRVEMEANLARLEDQAARNRDLELYNRAVVLADEGKREEARRALEELLRAARDPRLVEAARRLLERLGG